MRITQGTFSFLPDLTDEEITAQIEYALRNDWACSVEFTDDPHPRNTYWEMWGNPMFNLKDAAGVMMEVNACRKAHPDKYVKVNAFDSTRGVESLCLSFIVQRRAELPRDPPGIGRSRRALHAGNRPTVTQSIDLKALLRETRVEEVLDQLDRELIGLAPVKARLREIAAFLVVSRARKQLGLEAGAPNLHMCFTGNPGTGKTTVAERMASILHRLGYVRKGHLVSVTRDDLVGQYIGHTAPKTKEVLKRAMGGVLFIDEAYYLYRPENERDYGQEAIEILLQVMENQRDDLVVILAGYKDRMDTFFRSNPGFSSRITHHLDFPDYSEDELLEIAQLMVGRMHYRLADDASCALREYIARRMQQPRFANARSIRNALDRMRLRQANRLFNGALSDNAPTGAEALQTLSADDIRASSVFRNPSSEAAPAKAHAHH
jgi:probable Rubsico expression protein CbbX